MADVSGRLRRLVDRLGPQSPLGMLVGVIVAVGAVFLLFVIAPPLLWATLWLWRLMLAPVLGWWWRLWLPGFH